MTTNLNLNCKNNRLKKLPISPKKLSGRDFGLMKIEDFGNDEESKASSIEERISNSKSTNIIRQLQFREINGTKRPKKDIFTSHRDSSLYQRDLRGNTGCVNAAEFSNDEKWIVSGGDDMKVRLWKSVDCCVKELPKPCSMKATHYSNIFALRFSHQTERIYSAGNDRRLIVHEIATGEKLRQFKAAGTIYRIATHPNNDFIIAASSDDGSVHIFDQRANEGEGSTKLKQPRSAYSVEYNPVNPHLLVICNELTGLRIYDVRNGKDNYYTELNASLSKRAICADWSPTGDGIFAIRSGSNPIYLNLRNSEQIELRDPEYSNQITIKSCAFAGPEYVITGSDDWNIYVWKIPVPDNWQDDSIDQAYAVLKGHRSVVNHVRYGERSNMLVSCGVEKIVKLWSDFPLQKSSQNPIPRVRARMRSPFSYMDIWHNTGDDLDDTDEDLLTLHRFDHFYDQAISRPLGRGGWMGGSSLSASSSDTELMYYVGDSSDSDDDVHEHESFLLDSDVPLDYGNSDQGIEDAADVGPSSRNRRSRRIQINESDDDNDTEEAENDRASEEKQSESGMQQKPEQMEEEQAEIEAKAESSGVGLNGILDMARNIVDDEAMTMDDAKNDDNKASCDE